MDVISNFVCQAIRNEPLTIYGDGSQTRSFCYVDDMVDGLIRLMNSESANEKPINLGNPNEFVISHLVEIITHKIRKGDKMDVKFKQIPKDDPKTRCPDIEKAFKTLGWKPKIELSEGLDKTIEYFQKELLLA
jgi:UDP-glucuronate decarboxylase